MNMQRFEAYLTNNNFLKDYLIGESIKILYFSIMIDILNLFLSYFPKHQRYCRYIYIVTPQYSLLRFIY